MAQIGRIHDGVHMKFSPQLLQVDVLVVLVPKLLNVGYAFLFGFLRDLVGEDGIHGGFGAHDRDAGCGQCQRGVRIEAGPAHGIEARSVGLAHHHANARCAAAGHGADHLRPVADDALLFHGAADHEARHIAEEHQGKAEGVAEGDEARGLVGAVHEEHAALHPGLVGKDTHGLPVQSRQSRDDLPGEELLHLKEAALIHQPLDEVLHLEGGHDVRGHDGAQGLRLGRYRLRRDHGQRVFAVLGEVGQILLAEGDGLGLGLAQEVAAAAHGTVHLRAPQVLQRDLLADDHLRHAGRA